MELAPHHLLRIRGMEDLFSGSPFPGWVAEALHHAPWVVVRRATESGRVPVGVRGRERGQRFAAWLSPDKILETIPPSALVDPASWKMSYPAGPPQPLQSLRQITPFLQDTGYSWGPTGSLAFELATGYPSIKESSDLDILLDVPAPITVAAARSLLAGIEIVSLVRLDVQMNTPAGGVALKEYCTADRVLVKTATGPILLAGPALWE